MSETVRPAVQPRSRHSRWPWFAWLFAILAIATWWSLYKTPWFIASQVKVLGVARLDEAAVIKQAKVTLDGPLISIPLTQIQGRLTSFPEVDTVLVERGWPHTVLITIRERVPVAYQQTVSGITLIDKRGRASGLAKKVPEGMVSIEGKADSSAMKAAVDVLAALPTTWKVDFITASTQDSVTVHLKDKSIIVFGSGERVTDKAAVAEALLANRYTYIDVSAPDVPTTKASSRTKK